MSQQNKQEKITKGFAMREPKEQKYPVLKKVATTTAQIGGGVLAGAGGAALIIALKNRNKLKQIEQPEAAFGWKPSGGSTSV